MSGKILVGFATDYGSTQEVAEAIAKHMVELGRNAELLPLKQVRSLDGYSFVIMGAPLYMFHWHREAHSFLSRFRNTLENLPTAIFALGPMNDKEEEWTGSREHITKELAKYDWLKPAALEVFGGRFDPAKLRFPYSLIPAMKSIPASDIRDWNKINAWADNLSARFA